MGCKDDFRKGFGNCQDILKLIEDKDIKFFKTTQLAYFIGFGVHILIAPIFWYFEIYELFILNLFFSIPAFLMAIILNAKSYHNLAFVFGGGELLIHQIVAVSILGWDSGFQYFLIYLTSLSFFNAHWSRGTQRALMLGVSLTFISLYILYGDIRYSSFSQLQYDTVYLINAVTTLTLLGLLTYHFVQNSQQSEESVMNILHNTLPEDIVKRLQRGEKVIADRFDSVTVLFADIVGFTKLSQRVSPDELVEILNRIFTEFDLIAKQHNLEKIKTIGDAYMVVGGVPNSMENHIEAVSDMAIEMHRVVDNSKYSHDISIRIGIDSGEVTAGVIGVSKLVYDLWGDTVNTASRMESHGESGKIQITESVATALKDNSSFSLEERGEVIIKGKGLMRTWWLKERE
jgi:class 3 adenylate cyclase